MEIKKRLQELLDSEGYLVEYDKEEDKYYVSQKVGGPGLAFGYETQEEIIDALENRKEMVGTISKMEEERRTLSARDVYDDVVDIFPEVEAGCGTLNISIEKLEEFKAIVKEEGVFTLTVLNHTLGEMEADGFAHLFMKKIDDSEVVSGEDAILIQEILKKHEIENRKSKMWRCSNCSSRYKGLDKPIEKPAKCECGCTEFIASSSN